MAGAQSTLPVIVDTDAGTDDLLAIAYLLASPEIRIEAITVVHGLAHVREGAHNIRRLLQAAGKPEIPVFEGEERPLKGNRPFPGEWRSVSDKLPGVTLPEVQNSRRPESAMQFLKARLRERTNPARILALGPLTHVALALRDVPRAATALDHLVIMGGAVTVKGNLSGGNPEKAANEVAEWNIYCDPHAAAEVLKSRVQTLLVPLDATMHVPITRGFIEEFNSRNLTPLGRVVAQILQTAVPYADQHAYFAWDPLAAMVMVDFSVVRARRGSIDVVTRGKNIGQTRLVKWNSDFTLSIGVDADAQRFTSSFERAFVK
jgi:inosine-uridine nucleoside N-ribohydrolase